MVRHFTTVLSLAVALQLGALTSASGQTTARISVDSAGAQGNSASLYPSLSSDGRFVSFESFSSNLIANDTNGWTDIFVHDRLSGTTERVSVDSSGAQANSTSSAPTISADARFVAFVSDASNLVSGDLNGCMDVFVHDRQSGTTERVSVDSSGTEGNSNCFYAPSLSADGRFVAFTTYASNLVANDTNGLPDVFVHDRQGGTTERVSVDSSGAQGADGSYYPSISADGGIVAFYSAAYNLVAGDTNGQVDVFVHDRQSGATDRVSVDSSGVQANSFSTSPSISGDGRFVSFMSAASNLVAGDSNAVFDSFVHDRQSGTTERVSVDSTGAQGNGDTYYSSISADGGSVAFYSFATNLVSNDTNGSADVFVHDRQSGKTQRVSVDSSGTQGNAHSEDTPSISADGRLVAFDSLSSNLVAGDTNGYSDVFVHGPDLTLEASPSAPIAGATLTFSTFTGKANGASLLVVIDLNGTPLFFPVVHGSFDTSGLWTFAATVPSGLSGNVVTFETIGFVPSGKVAASNSFAVSFQ